jgi:hypothetical protein
MTDYIVIAKFRNKENVQKLIASIVALRGGFL